MQPNVQLAMAGGRLAYVIIPVPLKKVKRVKVEMTSKVIGKYPDGKDKVGHDMVKTVKDVTPGYMVYFPMGHVLHMSQRALRRHKLDQPAKLVNVRELLGMNESVLKLMQAQDEVGRQNGFADIERNTIQLATRKTGHRLLLKDEPAPSEFGEAPIPVFKDVKDMVFKPETDSLETV